MSKSTVLDSYIECIRAAYSGKAGILTHISSDGRSPAPLQNRSLELHSTGAFSEGKKRTEKVSHRDERNGC